MSSKYTENVICLYCNKEVIRKTDTKHDGKELSYKSAVSRNISSMLCLLVIQSSKKFPSSSTNLSSEHNIQFEDEELDDSLDPPSKVPRVSAQVGSGNDASLVELSDKGSELSSQVKTIGWGWVGGGGGGVWGQKYMLNELFTLDTMLFMEFKNLYPFSR